MTYFVTGLLETVLGSGLGTGKNGREKMNSCKMEKFAHTWVKSPRFWAQD